METQAEIIKLAEQNANECKDFAKYSAEWSSHLKGFINGYEQKQKKDEDFALKFAKFHYNRLAGACQSSNDFYVKQSLELFNQNENGGN